MWGKMKKKMLIANWKSNETEEEVAAWLQEFGAGAVLQQDISNLSCFGSCGPFADGCGILQNIPQISVAETSVDFL